MRNLTVVALLICIMSLCGCNESKVIEKGIILSGQGTAKSVPDIADFSVTVVTTDPSNNSTNAIHSNAEKCSVLSAALAKAGVNTKDIATTDFQASSGRKDSGYPSYRPVGKPFFRVRNSIRVTVRNVKDIGKTIDAAISAGATNIGQVGFRFSDPAKLKAQALGEAVKDAKVRAQAAAEAGGVKLLTISRVEESIPDNSLYENYSPRLKKTYAGTAMSSTFAQPGEEKITVGVMVTFAIKRS